MGTQARQAGRQRPHTCLAASRGGPAWSAGCCSRDRGHLISAATPPTRALQLTLLKVSASTSACPFHPGPERLSPPCHQGCGLSSVTHPPHPSITRPGLARSARTVCSRSKERIGLLLPVPASLLVSVLRFSSGPGSSPPRVGRRHRFLDFVVKSLSHGWGKRNSLQMERDSQRTERGGKET